MSELSPEVAVRRTVAPLVDGVDYVRDIEVCQPVRAKELF